MLFVVPEGMIISVIGSNPRAPSIEPFVAPGSINFLPGRYQLKLTNVPGREFADFYAALDIPTASAAVQTFLVNNSVAVRFTEDDFDDVLLGNSVMKVGYLLNVDDSEYLPRLAWLENRDLQPGQNPTGEAAKRGAVIATIIMQTRKQMRPLDVRQGSDGR